MKKMILMLCVSLAGLILQGGQAVAETELMRTDGVVAAVMPTNCQMVETAQLSLSFNNISVTLDSAKSYMNDKMGEIQATAGDLGIQKLDIQNVNYSVYNNNGGGGCGVAPATAYTLSGSVSLNTGSAEQAATLMQKLGEKGYIVNLNVSSYRQCQ